MSIVSMGLLLSFLSACTPEIFGERPTAKRLRLARENASASALRWNPAVTITSLTTLSAEWDLSTDQINGIRAELFSGAGCATNLHAPVSATGAVRSASFGSLSDGVYSFRVVVKTLPGGENQSACSGPITVNLGGGGTPTPTPTPTPPTLSYTGATGTTGTVGVLMSVSPTSLSPGGGGAVVSSCGVKAGTQALPAGLSVNSATCVISGTPSGSVAATLYTIEVTNNLGQSAEAQVSLTVIAVPLLASVTITNANPSNSATYNLSFGAISGSVSEYCIRENNTAIGGCAWTSGGSLPASFAVSATNGAKTLSVWLRNSLGGVSARVDSNSVTLDTVAPSAPSGIVLKTPASSPGVSATPVFTLSGVSAGDTVSIYTGSTCNILNLKGSGQASGSTIDVTSSALSNGVFSFYADSTDPAGNRSVCSTVSASYEKVASPASLSITSPSGPHDFGNVVVGTTQSVTLTLTNGGGATANSIVLSGLPATLPRDASVASNCGTTLAAGASCSIRIEYAPTTNSALSATLNLAYGDGVGGASNFDFGFSGQGLNPASLSFNETAHYFGKVLINGSNHQPGEGGTVFTLQNSGEVAASLTNTETAFSTEFSYYDSMTFPGTGGTCTATILPGQSCTIVLAATPTTRGTDGLVGHIGLTPPSAEGQYSENFSYSYQTGAGSSSVSIALSFYAVKLMIARPQDASWNFSVIFSSPDQAARQFLPVFVFNPSDYPSSISVAVVNGFPVSYGYGYTGGSYPGDGRLGVSLCPGSGGLLPAGGICGVELEYNSAQAVLGGASVSVQPVNSLNAGSEVIDMGSAESVVFTATTKTFQGANCTCDPADSATYGGGAGTPSNPYRVCSAAHLERMKSLGNYDFTGQSFQQCADIDFGSIPKYALNIGGAQGFKGTYNGMGRVIKNLVKSNGDLTAGLCDEGMIYSSIHSSGSVRNLGIQNATAVFSGIEARSSSCGFGILAGKNSGTIDNVWTSGGISVSSNGAPAGGSGAAVVGGMVGVSDSVVALGKLWSTAFVQYCDRHGVYPAVLGGLIGAGDVTISNSFFAGSIQRSTSCETLAVLGTSAQTTAGGIVGSGAVTGTNLFNVGSITGSNHGRDLLTGISSNLVGGSSISNFGSITSSRGASSGISDQIGTGVGGVVSVNLLRNFGLIGGAGAFGIAGEVLSNAQLSQIYSFGNIAAHARTGIFGGETVLGAQGAGFVGTLLGSAEKVAVINHISLDDSWPADFNLSGFLIQPPSYAGSGSGLAGGVGLGGTLRNAFFIGDFSGTVSNNIDSNASRFSGIAYENQGIIDQAYAVIFNESWLDEIVACVKTERGNSTNLYAWGGGGLLAGRSQGRTPSVSGCTSLSSTQMLQAPSFGGFEFRSINGQPQYEDPNSPWGTWDLPGRFWPTPGF